MDLGLKGRTALILGAGGGSGSAIALSLAREGMAVAAADLDPDAAQRTVDDIAAAGGRGIAISWDLADLGRREGRSVQAVAAESTASIPIGRYGRPEEYADAVAFLASERAAYITGSTLRVDGGMIASI